jgi:uncharacterized membrane protein YeaQ/YmgE (transglycosylase-associated protein family)
MGILSWIILGGFAGWIASLLVNKTGEGFFLNILLGIVGGTIGGWAFGALGWTGVTGFVDTLVINKHLVDRDRRRERIQPDLLGIDYGRALKG